MDDLADTDAMARAMGFSTFGTQPANKRRKYNPHTDDAVVAAPTLLPIHNQGKGANATPLGSRSQNKNEILLEDSDEEGGTAVGEERDAGTTLVTAGHDDNDDDDPEPQYIDTSHPLQPLDPLEQNNVQSKINSIVGSAPSLSHNLGVAPHAATGLQNQEDDMVNRDGHQSGRKGARSHQSRQAWWEDYYDPTANMNPWERLEKEKNMAPVDAWLSWEVSKAKWEQVKSQRVAS
ncbi:hypothetical protein BX600DRAFT_138462 [Xylariales sp. PMI_506]|nr:hypothetical protein BX600DRAFT_138462 [Xylariales sp. PMI_506]